MTPNKKSKKTFKSSSDINNYNQFLLELDKTNIKERTNDKKIEFYINQINNMYSTYNTGLNKWNSESDINIKNDPNIYKSDIDYQKLMFMREKQKKYEEQIIKKENNKEKENIFKRKVNIFYEINNITDLLRMIEKYPDDNEIEYNINMTSLHKIKEPLMELNAMIGMQGVKENIVDQILFYIQNLHQPSQKETKSGNKKFACNDFMHTVIYGPPGTGKTEVAKIIGSIFAKLGILNKGTFKKVTRSDLVAGYLGQTAIKTKEVIKECLGGVLFIDEAYSLGNQEKRDSFSKECIDTLCEALSDHKDNLMVIIAGYETDLNDCFFKYNQGLYSRFTWRFKIDNYNAGDMHNIFIKKIQDSGWIMNDAAINVKWFEKNKGIFKFYGRDIETLFAKTKIAHSRRVFCLEENEKKKITMGDIEKGLEMYLKHGIKKDENESENYKKMLSGMYT
jgi:SpoVK/Ycf46/Vps4 family AAA+-type ATPase